MIEMALATGLSVGAFMLWLGTCVAAIGFAIEKTTNGDPTTRSMRFLGFVVALALIIGVWCTVGSAVWYVVWGQGS